MSYRIERCHVSRCPCFQSPPYSMHKESTEKLVGNDKFEGYAIDLIAEIAKILSK